MNIYLEFISNHQLLFVALVVVIILIIQNIVSDATRKFKLVTPAEAINLMNREDAVVIDVRAENEYKDGHIADAVQIPLSKIKDKADSLAKYKDRPVIFYCKTGSFANDASKTAIKQGLHRVHMLKGGLLAWLDANLPLAKKK